MKLYTILTEKPDDLRKIMSELPDGFKDEYGIITINQYFFKTRKFEKDIIKALFNLSLKGLNITTPPFIIPNTYNTYYMLSINNRDLWECIVKDILSIEEIDNIDKILIDKFFPNYAYKSSYYFIDEEKVKKYKKILKDVFPEKEFSIHICN